MPIDWRHYRSQAFDELLEGAGEPRTAARPLVEYLSGLSTAELAARRLASELTIKAMGITFTVYSDGRNVDRAWPFDILPRVISRTEWERTQAGLGVGQPVRRGRVDGRPLAQWDVTGEPVAQATPLRRA